MESWGEAMPCHGAFLQAFPDPLRATDQDVGCEALAFSCYQWRGKIIPIRALDQDSRILFSDLG